MRKQTVSVPVREHGRTRKRCTIGRQTTILFRRHSHGARNRWDVARWPVLSQNPPAGRHWHAFCPRSRPTIEMRRLIKMFRTARERDRSRSVHLLDTAPIPEVEFARSGEWHSHAAASRRNRLTAEGNHCTHKERKQIPFHLLTTSCLIKKEHPCQYQYLWKTSNMLRTFEIFVKGAYDIHQW